MSEAIYSLAAVLLSVIGVLVMVFLKDVNSQPTVDDDDAYCQSRTTWEAFVNEMRSGLKTSYQTGPDAVVTVFFTISVFCYN